MLDLVAALIILLSILPCCVENKIAVIRNLKSYGIRSSHGHKTCDTIFYFIYILGNVYPSDGSFKFVDRILSGSVDMSYDHLTLLTVLNYRVEPEYRIRILHVAVAVAAKNSVSGISEALNYLID